MGEPYRRLRTFYQDASGNFSISTAASGDNTLASAKASHTLFLQKLHVEVTAGSASKTWTFKDTANTPLVLVPAIDASAVAHFDFDFGPAGIPCTEAKNFILTISGAGAAGWASWEAYMKPTSNLIG